MQGRIIKGIAGFYYVAIGQQLVYECKAKGIFRKEKIKPMVGDLVEISILSEEEKTGNLDKILPRKSELIRPMVANVDQALVIFSIVKPNPDFGLLDHFLVSMEHQKVPCILCFNKKDIAAETDLEHIRNVYAASGYPLLFVSALKKEGMEIVKAALRGKVTTVAGPSGTGKSSLINCLNKGFSMETGEISKKIERGKHTTRHSELLCIEENTYIMDTPGFGSLDLPKMEKEVLEQYYPEFEPYIGQCRFQGCAHIHEPNCAVKEALLEGKISKERYENYCMFYEELKGQKKY